MGEAVAPGLARAFGLDPMGQFATRMTTGLVTGTAAAVMRGGKVVVQQIAVDAFGNALGSSLASASAGSSVQGQGPWSEADYRNGSDIQSDNAAVQRQAQPYYDQMVDVFSQDLGAMGAAGAAVADNWARDSSLNRAVSDAGRDMSSSLPVRADSGSGLKVPYGYADAWGPKFGAMDGSLSGSNLAARFGQGLWGAVKGVVVEPFLQVRDLGLAGASVAYNEVLRDAGDELWLPPMKSGMADAYANGASQTRLMLQSNPLTGIGVVSYDLTTATMSGDWGTVAEMGGGLVGGLAIGKGVSKYGGYGRTLDDIGATGPMASQMGAVVPRLVAPDVAASEALASGKYARRADVSYRLASEVNAAYPEGYASPYKPGTRVTEFTTKVDDVYARVHGEDNMARSWMMKREAVEGLTANQVQSKYALPEVPTYMSEVHVPAGIRIRTGIVNPIFDGVGNATQYELLQRLPASAFKNTVRLGQ